PALSLPDPVADIPAGLCRKKHCAAPPGAGHGVVDLAESLYRRSLLLRDLEDGGDCPGPGRLPLPPFPAPVYDRLPGDHRRLLLLDCPGPEQGPGGIKIGKSRVAQKAPLGPGNWQVFPPEKANILAAIPAQDRA